MNNTRSLKGMTLVELLVGIGIMSIVLTGLVTFFSQSSRAAVQSKTRADLQQEILNSQQLITGRLREAFYVWPTGQTLELSKTAGSNTNATYLNPISGTRYSKSTWLTGTDPILAMILPPVNSSAVCTVTATTSSSTANDGCYRFYAYYPVNRLKWTNGTSGANDPGADSANNNAWVMVQYMAYFTSGFVSADVSSAIPSLTSNLAYGTANAQILTDYIEPTINDTTTTGLTNANTTYTMFSVANTSGSTPSATIPVNQVTVNLAMARLVGNTLIRLPDATNEYSISVSLTNQGKIAGS